MQLCSSLSILWHCLSLELEWKPIFSSPVATAKFSQFAGLLNAALSQQHLSGFETGQACDHSQFTSLLHFKFLPCKRGQESPFYFLPWASMRRIQWRGKSNASGCHVETSYLLGTLYPSLHLSPRYENRRNTLSKKNMLKNFLKERAYRLSQISSHGSNKIIHPLRNIMDVSVWGGWCSTEPPGALA